MIAVYEVDSPPSHLLPIHLKRTPNSSKWKSILKLSSPTTIIQENNTINNHYEQDETFPILDLRKKRIGLPYLKIALGKQEEYALLDSGATDSFIEQETFQKIKNNSQYVKGHQDIQLITANRRVTLKATLVEVPIKFSTDNQQHYEITWKFLVTPSLNQKIYLGSDFLGSKYVRCMSKNTLTILPDMDKKPRNIPITRFQQNMHTNLYAQFDEIVPPNSMKIIKAFIEKDLPEIHQLVIEDIEDSDEQGAISVLPTINSYSEFLQYPIILENKSNDIMYIQANSIVGKISPLDETDICYQVNTKPLLDDPEDVTENIVGLQFCEIHSVLKPTKSQANTTENIQREHHDPSPSSAHDIDELNNAQHYSHAHNEAANKLARNPNLTEDEKEEMINKFKKDGYYPLTTTEMLEKHKNGIIELQEGEDKPKTPQELVDSIELHHLPTSQREMIKAIFLKHAQSLASHIWDCPPTDLVEADITLKEEAYTSCHNCKFVPIPKAIRDEVMRTIEQMTRYGIIGICQKPTNIISNLLVSRKKNGRLRILLDSRLINMLSEKTPCAIASINNLYDHLSNATHLSTLDLNQAYFSIPIAKDKSHLFSFFAPNRVRYCFLRAAQGYINSAPVLESLTSQVLEGIDSAMSYADDIVIATRGTFRHHAETIEKVLKRLTAANLKVSPKKLQIVRQTIEILGLTYDRGRFKIPIAKAQAIQDIPTPKTSKQLKSFIMTISFYRRFIPRFASLSLPLMEMTKINHRHFVWNDQAQESFEVLKQAVTKAIDIYPPDHKKTFYASSDASKYCSAFMVWQKDQHNNDVFIGASSRMFSQTEKNYSTYKKEVLALIQGLAAFDYFLKFAKIVMEVDAKSLLWLRAVKSSQPMLNRLALTLSTYQIEIRHVPGKQHKSDSLSRSLFPVKADIKSLTEEQARYLFEQLTLPSSYKMDSEFLKQILTDDGMKDPFQTRKQNKGSKATTNTNNFLPDLKPPRKIRPPRTTKFHPLYTTQYEEVFQNTNPTNYPHQQQSYLEQMDKSNDIPSNNNDDEENHPNKVQENTKIKNEMNTNTFENEDDEKEEEDKEQEKEKQTNKKEEEKEEKEKEEEKEEEEEDDEEEDEQEEEEEDEEEEEEEKQKQKQEEEKVQTKVAPKEMEQIKYKSNKKDKHLTTRQNTENGATKENEISYQKTTIKNAKQQKRTTEVKNNNDCPQPIFDNNTNPTTYTHPLNVNLQDSDLYTLQFDPLSHPSHPKSLNSLHIMTKTPNEDLNKLSLNAKIIKDGQITLEMLQEAQSLDPFTQNVLKNINSHPDMSLKKNILIQSRNNSEKIILPEALFDAIFAMNHYSILGRHMAFTKLEKQVTSQYFHPELKTKLKALTQGCYLCLTMKKLKEPRITYGKKNYATTPRSEWLCDLIDGLPPCQSYKYIIIFTDAFSLYSNIVSIKNKEAKTICQAFDHHVIKCFGIPTKIYSDNEPGIKSEIFSNYCEELGIQITNSAPHSPFSNGVPETTVNLTKEALRLYTAQTNRPWPSLISLINVSLNKRTLISKFTPEQLLFGTALQGNNLLETMQTTTMEDYPTTLKNLISDINKRHQEKRDISAQSKRKYANKTCREKTFHNDQLVLLRNFKIQEDHGSSLLAPYNGPYVIKEINNNNRTVLLEDTDTGSTRYAHMCHLKPIPNTVTTPPLPTAAQRPTTSNTTQHLNPIFPDIRRSERIAQRNSTLPP